MALDLSRPPTAIRNVMLGFTVDHEVTTPEDMAEVAHLFAAFPTNAPTGQPLVVSHGRFINWLRPTH